MRRTCSTVTLSPEFAPTWNTAPANVPFKMWLRVKERQIGAQTTLAAEKSAQYASHVERLEQRVRVLEQIVTDGGYDTAAKIEALREPRLTTGDQVQ